MKIIQILLKSMCIIMFCTLILFAGCKKEKDNNPVADQGQRIVATRSVFGDTLVVYEKFNYNGNLLVEILETDSLSTDSVKYTFQYAGTKIISETWFIKSNGNWTKLSIHEITGYSGDNPSGILEQMFDEGGNVIHESKTSYVYSGSLLMKMEHYFKLNNNWTLFSFRDYTYNDKGKIIQESDTTTEWGGEIYGNITTYYYDADRMTESLNKFYLADSLKNDSRYVYEYADNRLSRRIYYNWDSGTWIMAGEWLYEYNESGNLVKMQRTQNSYKVEYSYGDGVGNYKECLKIFNGEYILPGDPTPYPVRPVKTGLGITLMKKEKTGSFLP
jgi:hypothetical protein